MYQVYRYLLLAFSILLASTGAMASREGQLAGELSGDKLTAGGEPATLTIKGGKPPYKATDAGRNGVIRVDPVRKVVVRPGQHDPGTDTYTISGLQPGTGTVVVTDAASGLHKLSLTVVAAPKSKPTGPRLVVSFSEPGVTIGGTPVTVNIEGGTPPFRVEDAGRSGNVRINSPLINPITRKPVNNNPPTITGLRPARGVPIAISDSSGQVVKLPLNVLPAAK